MNVRYGGLPVFVDLPTLILECKVLLSPDTNDTTKSYTYEKNAFLAHSSDEKFPMKKASCIITLMLELCFSRHILFFLTLDLTDLDLQKMPNFPIKGLVIFR